MEIKSNPSGGTFVMARSHYRLTRPCERTVINRVSHSWIVNMQSDVSTVLFRLCIRPRHTQCALILNRTISPSNFEMIWKTKSNARHTHTHEENTQDNEINGKQTTNRHSGKLSPWRFHWCFVKPFGVYLFVYICEQPPESHGILNRRRALFASRIFLVWLQLLTQKKAF